MTITIEAKPLLTEVEIPGYGVFTVRLMGAGTEAEIRRRYREANDEAQAISNKYKNILDEEKKLMEDKNAADELKAFRVSEDYQKAQKEISVVTEKLQRVSDYAREQRAKLFTCEDNSALTKLFDELTDKQLNDIYTQVVESLSGDK